MATVSLAAHAEEGFRPVTPAFKPSDIFFDPMPNACPGVAPVLNNKPGEGIIAHHIEIRGWYVESFHGPNGRNEDTVIGADGICKGRAEDYHYAIIPDMEWIMDSERNPTLSRLIGASMRGHLAERCYALCPMADPLFDPNLKLRKMRSVESSGPRLSSKRPGPKRDRSKQMYHCCFPRGIPSGLLSIPLLLRVKRPHTKFFHFAC